MKQPAKLLAVTLLLVGCRGSTTSVDPFVLYGPHRVPPPATGSLRQTAPPYDQPPASVSSAPPVPATPLPASLPSPPAMLEPPPTGLPPRTSNSEGSNASGSASMSPPDHWGSPTVIPASGVRAADTPDVQREPMLAKRMREATHLRWGARPGMAVQQGAGQPSAASPRPLRVATVPYQVPASRPASVRAPIAAAANPAASGATVPSPSAAPGRLVEITELPTLGYTPRTFNPSAAPRPIGTGVSQPTRVARRSGSGSAGWAPRP